MSDHIHVTFQLTDQLEKDIISAQLFELGFDGIEELDIELHAFIKEDLYDKLLVEDLAKAHQVQYTTQVEPAQNWNALWESNFDPVVIDDFVTIRADFHPPAHSTIHEVIITPKMSFGTGHHATTYLMIQQLRELDLKHKSVADFGTGTGVLAIVAEMLGSNKVWAVDNDDLCIENATENIKRNSCAHIVVHKAAIFLPGESFDIILANINKNVIIDNIEHLIQSLNPGGKLLLSGLLKQDEYDILMACELYNIKRVKTVERDKWIAILLEH